MAQTGFTPIQIYSSSTTGNTPAAGNLLNSSAGSELAINIFDGKLFYKDNAGAVQVIGWKVVPVSAGGTGQTSYTDGQLLIGNSTGNTLTKATLTAGTGISITNGAGAITINATGGTGTVTSVSGTAPISVATGTTTPVISISQSGVATDGYLSSTDWNTFNNKGSGTVTSVSGTTGRITSTGGTTPVIDLASGIATAGTTGSATLIPVVTIDTYGRVTSITTAANPQGTVTSVGGTGTVNGITLTGTVTSSGSLTLGGTLSGIGNSQLTNSTISGVALGGSLFNLTAGTGVSFSTGTTYNGSAAITINATGTGGTVTSVAALTLGTTGTDLSSTVANGTTTPVITLNVPTASATNRGALSAADWTTFNGKQAALVSGTNIKTVSGVSLLGSGDVGTIGATYGGTGQSTVTTGDLLYGSAANTWSKLADVATGNALISGGVGVAPSWGKVGLTTHVTGTLPTANGGTNLTSFTSGGVVYASSTSALATNSGFYYNGSQVGVNTSTLSTAFLTINTAASVGLDIYRSDSSAQYSGIRFRDTTNANTYGSLGWDSTGLRLNADAGTMYFSTSGTERMRLFASGGVSIGNTTDPGATNLSVTGSIAFGSIAGGIGKVASLTRNSGSASGNVSYTGVGFKPSLIIFYGGIETIRDFMVGAGTTAGGRAMYDNFENVLGVTNQAFAIYYRRDFGGGNFNIQTASIASMDTDGFTLTWTRTVGGTGTANDIIFNYIAFR